ncbi:MAG TPA: hypothetical protein IAA30_02370 [Candidatus Treponema faecavium]|nr:hypothetical protein [Candidatus Treponema faecavium]
MEPLLEQLQSQGADISGSLVRFMQNEGLYVRCLKKFPAEAEKNAYMDDIHNKNWEDAIHKTHTLKGLTGNLGLTALYARYTELVRRLRSDEFAGIDEYAAETEQLQKSVCATIDAS